MPSPFVPKSVLYRFPICFPSCNFRKLLWSPDRINPFRFWLLLRSGRLAGAFFRLCLCVPLRRTSIRTSVIPNKALGFFVLSFALFIRHVLLFVYVHYSCFHCITFFALYFAVALCVNFFPMIEFRYLRLYVLRFRLYSYVAALLFCSLRISSRFNAYLFRAFSARRAFLALISAQVLSNSSKTTS